MKIKVRLSDAGLRDAERQIQEYKTTLNQKAKEFARALAQKALTLQRCGLLTHSTLETTMLRLNTTLYRHLMVLRL